MQNHRGQGEFVQTNEEFQPSRSSTPTRDAPARTNPPSHYLLGTAQVEEGHLKKKKLQLKDRMETSCDAIARTNARLDRASARVRAGCAPDAGSYHDALRSAGLPFACGAWMTRGGFRSLRPAGCSRCRSSRSGRFASSFGSRTGSHPARPSGAVARRRPRESSPRTSGIRGFAPPGEWKQVSIFLSRWKCTSTHHRPER